MKDYQSDFVEFLISNQCLSFGSFVLKSKRISPYFINMGMLNTGHALQKLGYFYSQALTDSDLMYNVLFGPAYKGIPLVSSLVVALASAGVSSRYSFNRKEVKDHGEGGLIVGAPLVGRVVIVDDVITAGTAIRESVSIINANNATLGGIVVALDRLEKFDGVTAIAKIEQEFQTKVVSIITIDHIVEYLVLKGDLDTAQRIQDYKAIYCV